MAVYDFSRVKEYLDETVRGKHKVPGTDLFVMREHEPVYRDIAGYANKEEKIALTENHLFYLYSCTKPITVTAGMRLIEEGKLDLEAPVETYLPEFKDVYLEKEGKKVPPVNKMLVKHLFTMTAGFDYFLRSDPVNEVVSRTNGKAGTREIVAAFIKRPLCFEPGERFNYSLCHDVLVAVIEVAAGKRFSEYLDEIMFTPLGMKDSTFRETPEVHARLARQYICERDTEEKNVVPFDVGNDFCISENYESGGAGIITSMNDYAIFADVMACEGTAKNGYRLLKPETVKLLRKEQLASFVMNNNFSCAAGPGYGYGLGVRTRLNQNEGQRSPIGEFGWDGADGAYIMMDPVNHLSVVFGMHVRNWPTCIGSDHAVLRDLIYDAMNL